MANYALIIYKLFNLIVCIVDSNKQTQNRELEMNKRNKYPIKK